MVEPKTSGNVSNLSVARLSSLNGVPNVRYYDPGTDEFICVAAAVVLAVDMLQSPTGRNNLESNGRDIVTEYQSKAKIMTEDLDVSQMTDYVNDFLRKIRQNFPYIVLKDLRWSRGQTTKETWGQENEDKYNTQNAAIMELNIVFISRLTGALRTYQDTIGEGIDEGKKLLLAFQVIMLRLAVTIAYELVHCFTGYLLKKSTLHTPANVSYGYGGDSSSGESGRKWEQRMFGGYIDARERGGEVLLGAKQQLVQKVYVAKAAVVEAILKRDFKDLPLTNDHPKAEVEKEDYWNDLTKLYEVNDGDGSLRLSDELILELKLYDGVRYALGGEHFCDFRLRPIMSPLVVGNIPLGKDVHPPITATFQSLDVDEFVDRQFVSTYNIRFQGLSGKITSDPYSPFFKVLSATSVGLRWVITGSFGEASHSRFGIIVNAPVRVTIEQVDDHGTKSTKYMMVNEAAGPYYYREFATGSAKIKTFKIDHTAPFNIAAFSMNNVAVGVHHRSDHQLMLVRSDIPDQVGKSGFITLEVVVV